MHAVMCRRWSVIKNVIIIFVQTNFTYISNSRICSMLSCIAFFFNSFLFRPTVMLDILLWTYSRRDEGKLVLWMKAFGNPFIPKGVSKSWVGIQRRGTCNPPTGKMLQQPWELRKFIVSFFAFQQEWNGSHWFIRPHNSSTRKVNVHGSVCQQIHV